MTLTEKEKQEIDNNLTEKEKEEIKNIIGEMWAIYLLIEKGGLHKPWMDDSERFIGFGFFHTKALVKHSITLSKLTRWLIGLTTALLVLSIVQITLFFT